MIQLEHGVKRLARQWGFDLVAIREPYPSTTLPHYRRWLERGYHGQMDYLARSDAIEKRADPKILMPEVQSIIAVGMSYYPGAFPLVEGLQGRVSRYAWGLDYHDVMLEKLGRLADQLRLWLSRPISYRAYVDFGPVMERELAQQAGLGWIGKNTTLIHPKLGSYFFLGELFVDVRLEPDEAGLDDRCGSCTACLEACPTGALVAPRMLDARRCISYLTIEHRDAIPPALRPSLSDWVFGCDICQEVCPWNKRFAHHGRTSTFAPEHPFIDLVGLLEMDEEAFFARFRDTPLWRTRRAGLLRNAAVVMGNLGAAEAVPALRRARGDRNDLVRRHAAWALEQIQKG